MANPMITPMVPDTAALPNDIWFIIKCLLVYAGFQMRVLDGKRYGMGSGGDLSIDHVIT
jgi:hypothetical protein